MSDIRAYFADYKKAFLLTVKQDDYKILLTLFETGKYLGAMYVPQRDARFSSLKNVLLISLLIMYFTEIYYTMQVEYNLISLLNNFSSISDGIFVGCFLLNVHILSGKTCSVLYDNFREMEQIMESLRFRPSKTKWNLAYLILLFCCGYITIISYQLYSWISSRIMSRFHMTYAWIITSMYIIILLSYTFCATSFLKSRYMFVESKIRSLKNEHHQEHNDIDQMMKFLKTAYGIVERLNSVLGLQFFALINTIVINLVNVYCFELYVTDTWDIKASEMCSLLPEIAVMIILVMSCDAVEQCGKNVIQACYELHHKTAGDERIKSQILLLATYAEEWRPIFSAAGFYDVNQKCLNSIFSKNHDSLKHIHIVIGNESCDMDSSISSVILAYFLQNHRLPEFTTDTLVIPIQNTTHENFLIRPDNCLVYKQTGIPLDLFVFRNQLNFDELHKSKKITTSIVDHHMLSANDKILEDTIIQIIDHRPTDCTMCWNEHNVQINIQQVGSCITLIAEKMISLSEEDNLLCKEIAYLIYETIIYDTVALLPENGRAKELDIEIAELLENTYNFNKNDRKILYDKLWKAHNDVSNLTPKQILMKDLKIVESIPVPGLPMLVETFLKIDHSYDAIRNFAEEQRVSLLVLIGLDASNGVKRDVAVYFKKDGELLKDTLINKLYDSKNYNFLFTEVNTDYSDIICLRQGNIKLSRKQIVPLIKDTVLGK